MAQATKQIAKINAVGSATQQDTVERVHTRVREQAPRSCQLGTSHNRGSRARADQAITSASGGALVAA
jgi:hypothetical protein